MIVTASLDKQIIFWDVVKRVSKQSIQLKHMSVQQIIYSVDFRALYSIDCTKNIWVWSFDKQSCYHAGYLKGHNAEVTAVAALRGTPMLISVDEFKFIKTWDIWNFRCVQTLHYDFKGQATKIYSIDCERFCVVTDQWFHWFAFEEKLSVNRNGIQISGIFPIHIEYNSLAEELAVVTQTDIRMIDIHTGKQKRILANIVPENKEITLMKLLQTAKKTSDIKINGKRFSNQVK